MKLFLDSANLDHIREAVSWGIIDGLTTDPTLFRHGFTGYSGAGSLDMEAYIKNILAAVGRMSPVSLEIAALTEDEMVQQGVMLYEKFNQVAGNVVIKVPVCTVNTQGEGDPFDGLRAINRLYEEKIPVNATLVFTPEQALMAAKAGADYVSPFAGRIDDRIRRNLELEFRKSDYFPNEGIGDDDIPDMVASEAGLVSGVDLVQQTVDMFFEYEIECEVIASSLRNPLQVREVAGVGVDIATVPFEVLKAMILNAGCAEGIDTFSSDLLDEYRALFNE